jgi:hypothetical protein
LNLYIQGINPFIMFLNVFPPLTENCKTFVTLSGIENEYIHNKYFNTLHQRRLKIDSATGEYHYNNAEDSIDDLDLHHTT